MKPRALILSAFLAAFVLVVIGGVVAHLTAPSRLEGPTQATAETPPVAAIETLAQPSSEREARYRDLVAEANRRLLEQQQALDDARLRVQVAERKAASASRTRHDDDDDDDDDDGDDDDDHRFEHEHHDRREG